VIASVVCGCGGSVGVGCVDMQVRRGVIFALKHRVHHPRENIPPVAFAVFQIASEDAEQSYTSPQECFKEVSVAGWSSEAITPFLNNVQHAFCSQLTGLPIVFSWIVLMSARR
jgi:hypothetical protein